MVRELVSLQEQLDSLMNGELENSLGPESIMTCDEDASNNNEDVVASQNDNKTTPTDVLEAHQDQIDGGSSNENSEASEADLIREQASGKIEKDATTSCTDEGVESAPELIIEEDEKSSEVVTSDETIAEKDHEDLVIGQGSGIPLQKDDSSAKATDDDPVRSELTELPIGVLDDDLLAEADVNSADQEKQQLVIESSIISEPRDTAAVNKDSSQPVETHEVLDLPFNIVDVESDSKETCPIERPLDIKCGIEEDVDVKTGDARINSDDHTVQQPQNFITQMIEASDEIWNHTTHENEMPSHLLQVPISKQETSLISKSANSDDATDPLGAEAKSDDKKVYSGSTQQSTVDEERQPVQTQASQRNDQVLVNVPEECNTKQPTPTETLKEQGLKDASPNIIDPTSVADLPARDDVMESNRSLSEENERMRNMIEKLIKSGQEQLSAISSLSGRVKDLEKKLSRKNKLKVKQYRATRSRSSCLTKFDDGRTVGAAM